MVHLMGGVLSCGELMGKPVLTEQYVPDTSYNVISYNLFNDPVN